MAITVNKNLDPYYGVSRITHNAQAAVDSGLPTAIGNGERVFLSKLNNNVLVISAILTAGTATIRLKRYNGKLSELLDTETWTNGAKFEIAEGTTTLTPTFKFDTQGATVAVYLEAIAGGNITIEASLGAVGVANN